MKKNKLLKTILVIAALSVIVLFIILYFVYADIKSKNEHASFLSNEFSSQDTKRNYLASTQKTIKNIGADIDRINNSILAKDGDVKFIGNLESMARQNGLSMAIDSLVLLDKSDTTSNTITSLKISAKTIGSWSGTYKFLVELESSPVKVKINKFDISGAMDGGDSVPQQTGVSSGSWQSNIEMEVLKYK